MKSQLTEKQWNEVVAEVTRLAQAREDEQTQREVTAQVLQDLQLPTDLLDDAVQQVQYQAALAKQRRQRLWLSLTGVVLLLLLIASVWMWTASRSATFARIHAEPGQVTRSVANVTTAAQEVFFRTTLRDVPLGEKLSLSCDWFDPSGKIFHQSRWETRETNKAVWETQCRCPLSTTAPKGQWKVEMKLGDRLLTASDFKVE